MHVHARNRGRREVGSELEPESYPAAERPYEDILARQIDQGEKELERDGRGLFLSSLSAGLDIGFGPLLMAAVLTFASGAYSHATVELLLALMYSIGFIFVVLGETDLYTELTARGVFPVLAGRSSIPALLRLWVVVIAGNLVGGILFAALAVYIGTVYGIIEPSVFTELATTYTERTTWELFVGAVVAGWLMGLVAWLVVAASGTLSRIAFVVLTTGAIALLHLPHSIAGNVEVSMGLFTSPAVAWADHGRFLVASLAGNAVGGVIFVALLKYGGERQVARAGSAARE